MTRYVFDPPEPASVAIRGSSLRFPVRRVFCVGRNYAAHAREMGKDPDREPPFFFGKPADTVVDSGTTVPYPALTKNLHHEIELVVAIGAGGSDISPDAARGHVWGYGVGIDLTRRDLQDEAKAAGRPWDWSKGFDRSAPCAPLVPAAEAGDVASGRIWLSVNGATRQDADVADMIWPVEGDHRGVQPGGAAGGRGPDLHRHAGRRRRAQGRRSRARRRRAAGRDRDRDRRALNPRHASRLRRS